MLRRLSLAMIGLALGAIALLVAATHFALGPIEPGPGFEVVAARSARAIREAVVAAAKGERQSVTQVQTRQRIGPDDLVRAGATVMGAMAMIAGVIGFVRREDRRSCAAAVVLGGAAVAFHVAMVAIGVMAMILLIGTIIGTFGVG